MWDVKWVSSSLAEPRLGGRVMSTGEMAAGGWERAGSRWCPAATAKGHTSGRVCVDAWQAAASRALDLQKSKSNRTCWGEWEWDMEGVQEKQASGHAVLSVSVQQRLVNSSPCPGRTPLL